METNRHRVQNIKRQWTNILLVISIVVSWSHMVFGECPHLCECKWKSGKESVLCLNASLNKIPNKLDAGTQVLDLTGNEINAVANDAFNKANLLNLQKIFLVKCRLKAIERYAFRKLKNLVELDLSYNLLAMVPSATFDSTSELRELKLIGNPIQKLSNEAFSKMPHLVRLELSNCKIASIEARAFAGLEASLEWLKLDGNKLVDVSANALTFLQNLHGLELTSNPWNCSCNLRPLREWMTQENIPYGIPPVCQFPPRLAGKSWDKIELDEYACIPHIYSPDIRAHGVEGRNITMSCMVGGVPEPNVRWMIRNRIIANLTGNSMFPAAQGRKIYMVNLQEKTSNLTILTAEVQDAGTYICAAENKAGKVEASVTLAVSRKPPDGILSTKIILASIIAIALFIVTSTLAIVCLLTLRRRKKMGRWSTQQRCESYEKIELNHKCNNRVGKSPRADRCNYTKSYGENGISVVGQGRKHGDYRNVPSEDDGTDGYEDSMETSNGTISNMKRENLFNWQGAIGRSPKPSDERRKQSDINKSKKPVKEEDADLHIPRLIEFSDGTPDSGPNVTLDQYDVPTTTAAIAGSSYTKSNWVQQVNRKRSAGHSEPIYANEKSHFSDSRTSESDCDSDKKFPDLLDISSLSNLTSSSQLYGKAVDNPFCTIPRKKLNTTRSSKKTESQSPLLLESSSRYGSSSFTEKDLLNRRLSSDSTYSSNALSIYSRSTKPNGRSSSFLNLVSSNNGANFNSIKNTSNSINNNHKRNPSLPSSPAKGAQKMYSPEETPLLDFSSLTSRKQLITTPSPSTSTTAASAYDYHAAQLERFLEEYRNLQEQLCKMKETCESIRKKETPLRGTIGNSAKYADPVLYTTAFAGAAPLPLDEATTNPKGILKAKTLLPNQPPDPPPYWLHRNAMLKRLQDPGGDFFKS